MLNVIAHGNRLVCYGDPIVGIFVHGNELITADMTSNDVNAVSGTETRESSCQSIH